MNGFVAFAFALRRRAHPHQAPVEPENTFDAGNHVLTIEAGSPATLRLALSNKVVSVKDEKEKRTGKRKIKMALIRTGAGDKGGFLSTLGKCHARARGISRWR